MLYLISLQSYNESINEKKAILSWLHASIAESVYHFDIRSIKASIDQAILNEWLIKVDVYNEFGSLLTKSDESNNNSDKKYTIKKELDLLAFSKEKIKNRNFELDSKQKMLSE